MIIRIRVVLFICKDFYASKLAHFIYFMINSCKFAHQHYHRHFNNKLMKRIFSLLFIFAAVALQAQTFRLEFKPVAGTEYPVNMEVIQDMTIKVPAMGDMTTHTEQKIGAILTLVEEVEKGYLMETRLTRFTVNTSAQGQSQNFDSEGEDVVSQAIKTITEKPFRLVISRQGEVVENVASGYRFLYPCRRNACNAVCPSVNAKRP
jgi:hypothetical protein